MPDQLIGSDLRGGITHLPTCECGDLRDVHLLRANDQSNSTPCTRCDCVKYRPDPETLRLAREAGEDPYPTATRESPFE